MGSPKRKKADAGTPPDELAELISEQERDRSAFRVFPDRPSEGPEQPKPDKPSGKTVPRRRISKAVKGIARRRKGHHVPLHRTRHGMSEGMGRRIVEEGPADAPGRIDFAFRLCFGRGPTALEQDRLLAYLARQPRSRPEAGWTMVARVLLNLDEFITRE